MSAQVRLSDNEPTQEELARYHDRVEEVTNKEIRAKVLAGDVAQKQATATQVQAATILALLQDGHFASKVEEVIRAVTANDLSRLIPTK